MGSNFEEPSPRFDWTDVAIARLRELVTAGISAAAIAEQLGAPATRNAVLGKMHRLGLSMPNGHDPGHGVEHPWRHGAQPSKGKKPPPKGGQQSEAHKRAHLPAKPVTTPAPTVRSPEEAAPKPPAARSGPKPLDKLAHGQCRYTDSTEPPFLFCAEPVVAEGKSWCARHAAIVFVTPSGRRI